MNFRAMKISTLLVLGGVTLWKEGVMQASLTDLTERRMPLLRNLGEARDQINLQAQAARNLVLTDKPEEVKADIERIYAAAKTLGGALDALDKEIRSPQGREALAKVFALRTQYRDAMERYMGLAAKGDRDTALAVLFQEVRPIQTNYF